MSITTSNRVKQILIAILSGAGLGCLLLAGLWVFNRDRQQPLFAKLTPNFQPISSGISIDEMMKNLPSPSPILSTSVSPFPTENIPQPSPNTYQSPTISSSATTSGCLGSDRVFVRAETNNFLIYICGNDRPTNYVGIAKNGGGNISLPISQFQDDRFIVTNNNVSYIVTPQYLTITQNGRTIQTDPIVSYRKN
jgi:hypothetical protein